MIRIGAQIPSSPRTFVESVPVASRVRTDQVALLLERTTFYGLLTVVVLAAIPYGTVEPWWIALVDCLIFVLCSLRIAEATLRRNWTISGVTMLLPLLLLCCFAVAQTVPFGVLKLSSIEANSWRTISTDTYESQRFAFRLLALILMGEALLRYTSSRRRLGIVVGVVIGIGVLSAGFGLVRQVAQSDPTRFVLPDLVMGQSYGHFINRNHFAMLIEMSLGLLVGLIVGKTEHRGRFLMYLAMAFLVWAALVFTNSRGGLISMLGLMLCAALIHLTIVRWRARHSEGHDIRNRVVAHGVSALMSIGLAVALIFVTAVGVSWVGGDTVVSHLETVSGELNSGQASVLRRKEIWQATWELIKSHPVVGTGFGGYWTAIPGFTASASGSRSLQQAHNDYLEILAGGGIIGALFVLWFVFALVRNALKKIRVKDSFRYSTCLGALCGLFAVSIHSLFDFGLHTTANALVFTALVVISTATLKDEKRERRVLAV